MKKVKEVKVFKDCECLRTYNEVEIEEEFVDGNEVLNIFVNGKKEGKVTTGNFGYGTWSYEVTV